MKITKSIQIDCGNEELWSWLTEFDKLIKWNKSIVAEEHISEGEVGKGFLTKVLIREGNREIWYNNEILEYRPYQLLRIALSGGTLGKNSMVVVYRINKKNKRSELIFESTWRPSGLFLKILHPLINIKARKNTDEVLRELKQQIEK